MFCSNYIRNAATNRRETNTNNVIGNVLAEVEGILSMNTFHSTTRKKKRRSINLKKPRIYWKIYIILAGYSNMCKFIFNHLQAYHVYIIYKIYVLIFDLYITMTLHGYRVAYHDDFFLIIWYILLLSWHSLLWEPFFLYICMPDNKKIGSHLKLRQGRVKNIPSNKKQRGFAWHVTLHKW